jgi:hypothetical protein
LAGRVLIPLPCGAQPAAAILYDDSSRFAKTEPVLLRKLAEAWKPGQGCFGASPGTGRRAPDLDTSGILARVRIGSVLCVSQPERYSRCSGAIYEFNSLSFLPTAPGPKLI